MLTFIKLGGSLITDKRTNQHFHADVMRRAAQEIKRAVDSTSDLQLVIGHGSGSFGHVAAQKHGTADGVKTPEQWRGFAEVATVARRLNTLVLDILCEVGLPVMSIPPSASARCENGKLKSMEVNNIKTLLDQGVIPLIYGDVALDTVRGGTIISTETVFFYLAEYLKPNQIMLLGEVEGVYDTLGTIIPRITPENLESLAAALGGSRGIDVTGGMDSKVRHMVTLAQALPGLEIRIFGGTTQGQIESALRGQTAPGTLITGS